MVRLQEQQKKNLSFVILTYMTILGNADDISYHAKCAGVQLVNKGLVHNIFIMCNTRVSFQQILYSKSMHRVICGSGVPPGVSGVQTLPPPKNSKGPPKNHAKLNSIVKTVKKNC